MKVDQNGLAEIDFCVALGHTPYGVIRRVLTPRWYPFLLFHSLISSFQSYPLKLYWLIIGTNIQSRRKLNLVWLCLMFSYPIPAVMSTSFATCSLSWKPAPKSLALPAAFSYPWLPFVYFWFQVLGPLPKTQTTSSFRITTNTGETNILGSANKLKVVHLSIAKITGQPARKLTAMGCWFASTCPAWMEVLLGKILTPSISFGDNLAAQLIHAWCHGMWMTN